MPLINRTGFLLYAVLYKYFQNTQENWALQTIKSNATAEVVEHYWSMSSLSHLLSRSQLTVTHALDKSALAARRMLVEDRGADGLAYTETLMEMHKQVQKLM